MPPGIQYQLLFESVPGLYLILQPDLTIIAVSDAYLKATMTERDQIIGRGLFDVFPDNPDDPDATGVSNLRLSLNYVLQNGAPHTMAVQKYDIRRPDGTFEERYWSPLNKPVLDENNKIRYIIHRVEDVTEFVSMRKQQQKDFEVTEKLRRRLEETEMDIYLRAQEIQNREKLIQTIFSGAPDAVIVIDQEGRVVKWNPKAEALFGWSAGEMTGRMLSETIIPHRYRDAHQRGMLHFLETGEGAVLGKSVEIHAINKNQTEFDVALSISPVKFDDHYLFIGFVQDISRRKRNEALIQKQKQEIQDVIDSMSTLCAKVGLDGRMLVVNKTALMATGLNMEDLLQRNFLDGEWWTFDPDVHKRVSDAFQKACSGTIVNYDENIFVFGQVLTINFSMAPIFGKDGEVDYIVAEGRDITSLKHISAELQKQTEELANSNKELEAFSYSVSHDLRAPLRIIDGYTQLLITDYEHLLDDEGKRFLEVVKTNARKMGSLIDDLLNFSRLGRKELMVGIIDMDKLVKPILAEATNGRTVDVRLGRLEPAKADSNLLRQVWSNLISNAIKYSATRPDPTIHIASEKKDGEIIYSIRDNGVGFNMKYADKLFGVFQRLHKMTEFEGTGVGLALVQRIINRHGGRVWAEAEVNKGAAFYFSLPVLPPRSGVNLIHHKNESYDR